MADGTLLWIDTEQVSDRYCIISRGAGAKDRPEFKKYFVRSARVPIGRRIPL